MKAKHKYKKVAVRKSTADTSLKGIKIISHEELEQVRRMYGKSKPSTKRIMDEYIAPLQPMKNGIFIEKRTWEQKTNVRIYASRAFPERKFRAITKDNGTYIWREK